MPLEVPQLILVKRERFSLKFYESDGDSGWTLRRAYRIAVGAEDYETEAGPYKIFSKAKDPDWQMPYSPWVPEDLQGTVIPGGDARNPIKSRWMEFNDGAGIHGTADVESLGQAASHGCVRMQVSDVDELYELVHRGCPIVIA